MSRKWANIARFRFVHGIHFQVLSQISSPTYFKKMGLLQKLKVKGNYMFYTKIHPTSGDVNKSDHVGFSVLPAWFERGFEGIYTILNPPRDIKQPFVIVARLEVDYRAEVDGEGLVTIETGIGKIGTSSFTLTQRLTQHEKTAAVCRVTMVHFDYDRKRAVPLPHNVRESLEAHMVELF